MPRTEKESSEVQPQSGDSVPTGNMGLRGSYILAVVCDDESRVDLGDYGPNPALLYVSRRDSSRLKIWTDASSESQFNVSQRYSGNHARTSILLYINAVI